MESKERDTSDEDGRETKRDDVETDSEDVDPDWLAGSKGHNAPVPRGSSLTSHSNSNLGDSELK